MGPWIARRALRPTAPPARPDRNEVPFSAALVEEFVARRNLGTDGQPTVYTDGRVGGTAKPNVSRAAAEVGGRGRPSKDRISRKQKTGGATPVFDVSLFLPAKDTGLARAHSCDLVGNSSKERARVP